MSEPQTKKKGLIGRMFSAKDMPNVITAICGALKQHLSSIRTI